MCFSFIFLHFLENIDSGEMKGDWEIFKSIFKTITSKTLVLNSKFKLDGKKVYIYVKNEFVVSRFFFQ